MKILLVAAILFAIYLLVTCLIEGTVVWVVFRERRYVKYSIACNVMTNPLLNFWLYLIVFGREFTLLEMFEVDWPVLFVCGEVYVVLVEAWIYHYILQKKAAYCFLISVIANVCSAIGGLVLMWFEEEWISLLLEFASV